MNEVKRGTPKGTDKVKKRTFNASSTLTKSSKAALVPEPVLGETSNGFTPAETAHLVS